MRTLTMLGICTAMLALGTTGCGGDGKKLPVARIPKAAFMKRFDAICARTYNGIKAEFLDFVKGPGKGKFTTPEEISLYADTILIPAKRREVDELRALGAPRGDEERIVAIVGAYEDGIARAEESPRDAVVSSAGVFAEATELAEEYGLRKCRY